MPDRRSLPPPSAVGTSCPPVADLIHYALGQASSDERRCIEGHLHGENCSQCRSWGEKTPRSRGELRPTLLSRSDLPSTLRIASFPSVSDPTPIPPSSKWQRAAFRELEQRLRLLEES